jgi:hypothetical protein
VPWQAPQFTEIDMNAEIGAYQRDPLDDADRRRAPPPPEQARTSADPPDAEHDAASNRR